MKGLLSLCPKGSFGPVGILPATSDLGQGYVVMHGIVPPRFLDAGSPWYISIRHVLSDGK